MKKRLLFIPLFALVMTGCDFLSFFKKEETPINSDTNDHQNDDQHEDDDDHHDEVIKVSSISLEKNVLSLYEGESETLSYTIAPSNAENKNVTWSTTNSFIASVENGLVKAWNPGTCDITATTVDGNKTATCKVTVNKREPQKQYVTTTFDVNEQGYTASNISLVNAPISIGEYTVSFAVGNNTYNNQPSVVSKNKHYEIRVYWGNTFTIKSSTNKLQKIEFVIGPTSSSNSMSSDNGTLTDNVWLGDSNQVTFSVAGTNGYKSFDAIKFSYEGSSEEDEETVVNLGEKTIAEVKQYIKDHPIKTNSHKVGVNENRYVTIKGYALAKIDLVKYTAKFGLDVSEHGKVIMGDETGTIGVATVVNNEGTSLWGKIGDYQCKSTSKYIVTGYLSEYLGNPEILVTSFTWDQTLDINLDFSKIASETVTLEKFYEKASDVYYNCAGHGYGDVVTVKNLKCYYVEADGQGKRYYNFTDGTKNIRVNAFNISGATEGKYYNVTGIISLKSLSPIIIAFNIETANECDFEFDYKNIATQITISSLKAIHGSQEDTDQKYPEVVKAYGNVYKTTGYMVAAVENGKIYVGISDTPRDSAITGKTNAMANYNVVLIKNSNFWNTTEDELYLFNPIYDEYLLENKPIDVYFVTRQLEYSDKKPMWEILLLPDFLSDITPSEE